MLEFADVKGNPVMIKSPVPVPDVQYMYASIYTVRPILVYLAFLVLYVTVPVVVDPSITGVHVPSS